MPLLEPLIVSGPRNNMMKDELLQPLLVVPDRLEQVPGELTQRCFSWQEQGHVLRASLMRVKVISVSVELIKNFRICADGLRLFYTLV